MLGGKEGCGDCGVLDPALFCLCLTFMLSLVYATWLSLGLAISAFNGTFP